MASLTRKQWSDEKIFVGLMGGQRAAALRYLAEPAAAKPAAAAAAASLQAARDSWSQMAGWLEACCDHNQAGRPEMAAEALAAARRCGAGIIGMANAGLDYLDAAGEDAAAGLRLAIARLGRLLAAVARSAPQ